MKKELTTAAIQQPVLFLDDWPQPPMGSMEEHEKPGLTDVKKWRLQMLLAVNPWGVPSLALAEAYKKMYRQELNVQDLGFEHLFDMVSQLKDIFAIQEPDETTAIMFPDYPHDKILHDARVGHNFDLLTVAGLGQDENPDAETLNTYAWINRDDNFPPDVVLAGERYDETILPLTMANISGTRGVYQAVLTGAANPDHIYISIKSDHLDRVSKLSAEVSLYFQQCDLPMDMYSVPDEFVFKGFPCLVYMEEDACWERCEIIGRSPRGNKILVDTVDYGGTQTVNPIHLYLMPKKFFDFPKQGIAVSLAGIKPSDESGKWSPRCGKRIRCFSDHKYFLDCLLLEPKQESQSKSLIKSGSQSSVSVLGDSDKNNPDQAQKRKKKWQRKTQFEVIVCDRNDDDLDLYLDQVLVLETYALPDETRVEEIENLRKQLKEALSNIVRPVNPLKE